MATAGPSGNEIRFEYYDYDAETLLFEVVMDTGDLSTSTEIDNVPTPNSDGMEFVQWDLFAINGREVITAGVSFTPESNCPLFLVQNIEANGNDVVKATARWKVPVNDYIILDCGDASEWISNEITFYVDGKTYFTLPNMTWYDFCHSEYNIDNFYVSDHDGVICDNSGHNIQENGVGVNYIDTIRDNGIYKTSSSTEPT